MRNLAMLRAIQAFEVSARKLSFVDAAGELNVTAAAVGQQVRALEGWLGIPLFDRTQSGQSRLTLTDKARVALPDITEGLDRIDAGIRLLRTTAQRPLVTLSVSQAFMARWLMPRIHTFTDRHANIDIRFDVTDRLTDIDIGASEIAIRCGAGAWPALRAIALMDEEFFPVCSPALLKRYGNPSSPSALASWPLIHDTTLKDMAVFPTWRRWLKHFGSRNAAADNGLKINATAAVIDAALRAQGVALTRSAFVRDEIKARRLVRLVPEAVWSLAWKYFVVHSQRRELSEAAQLFVRWIGECVQQESASHVYPKHRATTVKTRAKAPATNLRR
jgi:LysR family transcriptional regulator, glycine cleavage system transcriptional activator